MWVKNQWQALSVSCRGRNRMLRDKIAEIIKQSGHHQNEGTKANAILELIQSHAKEKGWSKPIIRNVQVADMTVKREVFVPLADEDFK